MKNKDCLDIDRIAFLGRTYAEYLDMFGLDEQRLMNGPVLDCPAGASSFSAEAREKGVDVTACDILYGLPPETLAAKGRSDIEHVFERFDEASHLYVWNYYRNKDDVAALRTKALELFCGDFVSGKARGRYIRAELPRLPFPDGAFSLVLSANLLFLYGDRLDLYFHVECLKEFMRVCSGEVRIFPLVGLDAKPYPHLEKVLSFLAGEGCEAGVRKAPFEFQRGSNRMLIIRRS